MLPDDDDVMAEDGEAPAAPEVDADEELFNEDLEVLGGAEADDTAPEETADKEVEPSEEGEPAAEAAEGEVEAKPEEEAESAEAPEATPEAEAKAEPEAEPAPEPVQPVEEPTPQPAVEQPVPQVSAEEAAEMQATHRANAEKMLADDVYALPKELAEGLDPDIAEYIPKMGAKIFMDAVTHTLQQVQQMLPEAVNNITNQRSQTDVLENKFFEQWPALKGHGDKVVQFGQAYRQVNPTASPEDFIQDVGAQLHVALRIPIEGQAAPAEAPEAAPVKFQPAAKAAPRGAKKAAPGVFEQLDEDLFADEPY